MELTKVVVRYANGAIAKGFIQNFFPNKDFFYLTRADNTPGPPIYVSVKRLKAVFVVRDFRGNPQFEEPGALAPSTARVYSTQNRRDRDCDRGYWSGNGFHWDHHGHGWSACEPDGES